MSPSGNCPRSRDQPSVARPPHPSVCSQGAPTHPGTSLCLSLLLHPPLLCSTQAEHLIPAKLLLAWPKKHITVQWDKMPPILCLAPSWHASYLQYYIFTQKC